MSIKGKAYIAGIFEHPTRKAVDLSVAQLHAECAAGALADAGLTKDDVDGYFCAGDAPGLGPLSMIEYMGLNQLRHIDSTETGGSSYLIHIGHAAEAIAAGKCSVALVTLAGRPRADGMATGTKPRNYGAATCISTAPPANSWPGSRSRHRTTRSIIHMPCCAMS